MTARNGSWMPLFTADYLADTMRLTTLQHGAYLLLLMEYWRSGPLPDDDAQLASVAKMEVKNWRAQASHVVRGFFTRQEDGLLHQNRCDVEIKRAREIGAKRAAAARQRYMQNDSKNDANASANAQQTPSQKADFAPLTGALHFTSSSLRSEDSSCSLRSHSPSARDEPRPRSRHAKDEDSAEFQQFWQKYPRREGKGAARKSFANARKSASFEAILAALDRPWDPNPRFVPHPATWLNQQRWLDEPSTSLGARPETRVNPPFRNGFAALGARLAEQAAAVPKPVENRRLLEEKRDETTA